MNQPIYASEMQRFEQYVIAEEKSHATTEKYLRDVRFIIGFLDSRKLSKEETISYKQ